MLDLVTLRVAFALIALSVLVLFYVATYRTTRSAFSLWWVLSLLSYLASSSLFLLNGTDAQVVANPLGNAAGVLGSGFVYVAASSLRGGRARLAPVAGAALVVLVVSLLQHPADDVWAGGAVFLAGMWAFYTLGARELWAVRRLSTEAQRTDPGHEMALLSMLVISAVVAAFYFLRWVLFLSVGPDAHLFQASVGAQVTTLLLMLLLVVVTFNMSALSQSQLTRELQRAATTDGLTGLLNRAAFEKSAEEFVRRARHADRPGFVVMADFDDFKLLNDHYGHATGDEALKAFGSGCRAELRDGDVAARLGGDEFVLLLPYRDDRAPEETVAAIGRRLTAGARRGDHPLPSVSFGIAEVDRAAGLEATLARADAALYRAKGTGFGNAVRAE